MNKLSTLIPCRFAFDDDATFDGFAYGSTWNGFDNVAVTPAVRNLIVAHFAGQPDCEEANADLLAIQPDAQGLISLSWGYATQIIR